MPKEESLRPDLSLLVSGVTTVYAFLAPALVAWLFFALLLHTVAKAQVPSLPRWQWALFAALVHFQLYVVLSIWEQPSFTVLPVQLESPFQFPYVVFRVVIILCLWFVTTLLFVRLTLRQRLLVVPVVSAVWLTFEYFVHPWLTAQGFRVANDLLHARLGT